MRIGARDEGNRLGTMSVRGIGAEEALVDFAQRPGVSEESERFAAALDPTGGTEHTWFAAA